MTGNIRYDGPDTTVQTRQFPPWCPEIPAVVVATDGKQGGHLLLSNRHVFADEIEFPESDLSCVLGFLQWYCLNVMAWSTSLLQNAVFSDGTEFRKNRTFHTHGVCSTKIASVS